MQLWQGFLNRFRWWFIVWLTFMWILLMGEVTWGNFFAGLALGTLIVLALPLPQVPRSGMAIRWNKLIMFIGEWVWDLIVASAKVAWLALRREEPPKNAIVRVPMRVDNELVMYLATCAYNLQPGGSVTDIDLANREWTIHVLDARNEQYLQQEIDNVAKLERQMIEIFESKVRR